MAGVSRHMARSLASTARAAGRFCGSKGAAASGEMGAAARGGLGAAAPRSAPSSSFSSPKSFFMESRRPGAFFGRLPGEVAMIQSLLPLHNATASARMVSQLRSSAGVLLQELTNVMWADGHQTVRTAHSALIRVMARDGGKDFTSEDSGLLTMLNNHQLEFERSAVMELHPKHLSVKAEERL